MYLQRLYVLHDLESQGMQEPPYQQQENTEILHLLVEKKLLDENGIVVIEAAKEDIYEERCDSLILYKKALYGITQVLYYRQEEMK